MISVRYDLNLLRTFDALMAERNVTAAARRLGTSQPAVSGALARLRALFSDPLFTRARYGVVPTERAARMAPVVRRALRDLDTLVHGDVTFDPGTAKRTFGIAADPYFEYLLVPRLVGRIAEAGPRIRLSIAPLGPDLREAGLAAGRSDVALGRFVDPPENLIVNDALSDGFACLLRSGHPLAGAELTVERFERLRHVVVAPPGQWRSGVLGILDARGIRREVAVSVSHFLAVPQVLAATDHCATLPLRIARLLAEDARFRLLAPPVDLGRFPMQLAWHPRHRNDRGHAWLRSTIRDACAALDR